VAMTYVNTISERGVFDTVRAWLVRRGWSFRTLFWATGALAFVLSPVADNLTTALVLGTVVVAVGRTSPAFLGPACINIVVAANAGGAFSPFGDVTTLMVWQAGSVPFTGFAPLLLPSLINWLVPAAIMSFSVSTRRPNPTDELSTLQPGAATAVLLFLGTIAFTVLLHTLVHLPPALGMMSGLAVLKLFAFAQERLSPATRWEIQEFDQAIGEPASAGQDDQAGQSGAVQSMPSARRVAPRPLRTFDLMEKVEWDTLLFFYGVMLAVGGLNAFGYLKPVAHWLYQGLGPTIANVLVGLLSSVIDNVPVMFAVLSVELDLARGQWLLATLTIGVGGSLLSIGSAAGVALMGLAPKAYTFGTHLRWSWAIAIGYAASVAVHLMVNGQLF
ncbi:MAG: sodium:proton antiporter NhaD, partial [Chloroflexota bacterium]